MSAWPRSILLALICMSCCDGTALAQGLPCRYSVRVLPEVDCGLFSSPGNPRAINNLGHVLLTAFQCGEPQYDNTFLWTAGDTLTLLPRPPGTLGFTGTDLNDVGQVVGYAEINADSVRRGYIYDLNSGEWTELPPLNPPNGWSEASAITNDGRVCGYRSIGSKGSAVQPQTAFVWSTSTGFDDLGLVDRLSTGASDISADGRMSVFVGLGLSGLMWDGLTTVPIGFFPGADSISPNAIANGGRIVGGSLFISGSSFWSVPFEFTQGILTPLTTLGGDFVSCTAIAVTNNGVIVGACSRIGGQPNWRACRWYGGTIADLSSLVDPAGSMSVTIASAINEQGQILCSGRIDDDAVCAVLSAVPGIAGDTNCDSRVDIDDLLTVIGCWGPGPSPGDLNGDRVVDHFDLLIVINNWGS